MRVFLQFSQSWDISAIFPDIEVFLQFSQTSGYFCDFPNHGGYFCNLSLDQGISAICPLIRQTGGTGGSPTGSAGPTGHRWDSHRARTLVGAPTGRAALVGIPPGAQPRWGSHRVCARPRWGSHRAHSPGGDPTGHTAPVGVPPGVRNTLVGLPPGAQPRWQSHRVCARPRWGSHQDSMGDYADETCLSSFAQRLDFNIF
ncbi:hypothetical protein Taro_055881 [Colocasia esculenta]|uniref:Uncharacterized protein n=1 Tax=Colocasia esculenta TaxID=4460 RepID=A0A843XUK4_COLES|nr:hypothetical protein [Colocasia esculenta]